jgi:hypothetical protein
MYTCALGSTCSVYMCADMYICAYVSPCSPTYARLPQGMSKSGTNQELECEHFHKFEDIICMANLELSLIQIYDAPQILVYFGLWVCMNAFHVAV